MAKKFRLVLPGSTIGFDGKRREPLRFSTDDWTNVDRRGYDLDGDIEDFEERDFSLAEAWATSNLPTEPKEAAQEAIDDAVRRFLEEGGVITQCDVTERSGVFDEGESDGD
jgi:hypothetical protein